MLDCVTSCPCKATVWQEIFSVSFLLHVSVPAACHPALENALNVTCCTLWGLSFMFKFACSVRWSPLHIVLQDMRASKAAVAAEFNQAKMKVGNLEAALTRLKKEKEEQAVKNKARSLHLCLSS